MLLVVLTTGINFADTYQDWRLCAHRDGDTFRSYRHLLVERPRLADAGVQVSQEALDPLSLGLDGRSQTLLQFQALTDERAPLGDGWFPRRDKRA